MLVYLDRINNPILRCLILCFDEWIDLDWESVSQLRKESWLNNKANNFHYISLATSSNYPIRDKFLTNQQTIPVLLNYAFLNQSNGKIPRSPFLTPCILRKEDGR